MPKLPGKLLLFLAVAAFFYFYVLPRRNEFVANLLNLHGVSREDSTKSIVEEKIRRDICTLADLCEYKPINWEEYTPEDEVNASITHSFYVDGSLRKFLFRIRAGSVSEIVDLR